MRLAPRIANSTPSGANVREVDLLSEEWINRDRERQSRLLDEIARFKGQTSRRSQQLEDEGWIVDLRDEMFGVIAWTKNGKPHSGHRVRIQLCRCISSNEPADIDIETGEIRAYSSLEVYAPLPWRVKNRKLKNGDQFFEELDAALACFDSSVAAEVSRGS